MAGLPDGLPARKQSPIQLHGGPKTGPFLNVDNFAMVSGKYSLPNLHKYSLSLKLH